jgi:hypothetical protein
MVMVHLQKWEETMWKPFDSDALTTTHVAAPSITVGGRVIQRCLVCGEKLVDSRGQMAPLGPDGEIPEVPTWEAGRMVRVHRGNPTRFELLPDSDQLTPDSCAALVE